MPIHQLMSNKCQVHNWFKHSCIMHNSPNGPNFDHHLVLTKQIFDLWNLVLPVNKWNFPIKNILLNVNSTYFSQHLQRNVIFSILTRWFNIGLVKIMTWSKIANLSLNGLEKKNSNWLPRNSKLEQCCWNKKLFYV